MRQLTAKHKSDIERFEARISIGKENLLKNSAELLDSDRDIFINALLNPPKPSDHLLKAAKIYKKSHISFDR